MNANFVESRIFEAGHYLKKKHRLTNIVKCFGILFSKRYGFAAGIDRLHPLRSVDRWKKCLNNSITFFPNSLIKWDARYV